MNEKNVKYFKLENNVFMVSQQNICLIDKSVFSFLSMISLKVMSLCMDSLWIDSSGMDSSSMELFGIIGSCSSFNPINSRVCFLNKSLSKTPSLCQIAITNKAAINPPKIYPVADDLIFLLFLRLCAVFFLTQKQYLVTHNRIYYDVYVRSYYFKMKSIVWRRGQE